VLALVPDLRGLPVTDRFPIGIGLNSGMFFSMPGYCGQDLSAMLPSVDRDGKSGSKTLKSGP
jgi:hypothetical protein